MEKLINDFSVFFHKYKSLLDNNNYVSKVNYEDKCRTQVSIYSDETNSFSPHCKKCMGYLEYLDDVITDEEVQKQGIIYLYFWLHYYELQNGINEGNTLGNFKKLMNAYGQIGQNTANIHNVYNYYIENKLNYELNDLFYLYEKFDNFQKNKVCTDTKCTCAKECVEKYMSSAEKCKNYGNVYFCNELEKFRTKYNEYKPSVNECQEVQSYLPSCKNFSTSVIILISFITISVLSSLLFILYKFTPLGSCVRFRSKRPQRIYSNFTNEEAKVFYTRGRSRTPEVKPYNIAYNSI
ncbi:PIR protein [Plasmodium vivax]|uniref:VIR protein n=1 Tax=Plasmodium vivax TaxID=5855 RepID=A0A564ZPS9_PLAVI|nr:PIR protein [Plasmodium vivax]